MGEELTYDQRMALRQSFMDAARSGDVTTLARHLSEGCDINMQDWEGETAVMHAALNDRPEAIRFLARAGADLDIRENQGGTPLMWAAQKNHAASVEALIEYFADLTKANFAKITPIDRARMAGHGGIVRLIEDGIATEPARREQAAIMLLNPLPVGRPPALKKGAP